MSPLPFDRVTITPFSTDLHRMQQQLEGIEEGSFRAYLAYLGEACTNYVKGFGSRPFQSKDNSLLDYANIDNLLLVMYLPCLQCAHSLLGLH